MNLFLGINVGYSWVIVYILFISRVLAQNALRPVYCFVVFNKADLREKKNTPVITYHHHVQNVEK